MDYHLIGKNIKAERTKQHYTQEQLAEKIGISTNFLACIETGVRNGSFETYINIANALHTTLDTLTQGVVSACSENPLKDELNFYFDNSNSQMQEFMVSILKTTYEENIRLSDIFKKSMAEHRAKMRPRKEDIL